MYETIVLEKENGTAILTDVPGENEHNHLIS